MWRRVGAEPHASTAAARRDGELLPGGTGKLRNRGVLGRVCWWPHAHHWAQRPLAKPCPCSQLLCVLLCPVPLCSPAQLSHPAPHLDLMGRPGWTTALHGVRWLLKWPQAGTQLLLLTRGKQMEEGWWSLPWGAASSHHVLHTRLWGASHLKSLMLQEQPPGLQRCQLELCEPGHFILCSNLPLWLGEYGNWLLPLLLSGGVSYAGSISIGAVPAHTELDIWVPGITEGYFPGTSIEEPAKSWRHPAFTIRCLWFNKDSWGILYLFLSWKRPMKTIFLCLAKIFLQQLLSFH